MDDMTISRYIINALRASSNEKLNTSKIGSLLSRIKPSGLQQDLLSIIKSKYNSLLDFLCHMKHLFLVKMKGNDGVAVVSLLPTPTTVSTRYPGNYIDEIYEVPEKVNINSDEYLVSLIENYLEENLNNGCDSNELGEFLRIQYSEEEDCPLAIIRRNHQNLLSFLESHNDIFYIKRNIGNSYKVYLNKPTRHQILENKVFHVNQLCHEPNVYNYLAVRSDQNYYDVMSPPRYLDDIYNNDPPPFYSTTHYSTNEKLQGIDNYYNNNIITYGNYMTDNVVSEHLTNKIHEKKITYTSKTAFTPYKSNAVVPNDSNLTAEDQNLIDLIKEYINLCDRKTARSSELGQHLSQCEIAGKNARQWLTNGYGSAKRFIKSFPQYFLITNEINGNYDIIINNLSNSAHNRDIDSTVLLNAIVKYLDTCPGKKSSFIKIGAELHDLRLSSLLKKKYIRLLNFIEKFNAYFKVHFLDVGYDVELIDSASKNCSNNDKNMTDSHNIVFSSNIITNGISENTISDRKDTSEKSDNNNATNLQDKNIIQCQDNWKSQEQGPSQRLNPPFGQAISKGQGQFVEQGLSKSKDLSQSEGHILSQSSSISNGQGQSLKQGLSKSKAPSQSEGKSLSLGSSGTNRQSLTNSQGISRGQSQNILIEQDLSKSKGPSQSEGQSLSLGTSGSNGQCLFPENGLSKSKDLSQSEGHILSQSSSISNGQGQSLKQGLSKSKAPSQSEGKSLSLGSSGTNRQSLTNSQGISRGQSQNILMEQDLTKSKGPSQSEGQSLSLGRSLTNSPGLSQGQSSSLRPSKSKSPQGQGPTLELDTSSRLAQSSDEGLSHRLAPSVEQGFFQSQGLTQYQEQYPPLGKGPSLGQSLSLGRISPHRQGLTQGSGTFTGKGLTLSQCQSLGKGPSKGHDPILWQVSFQSNGSSEYQDSGIPKSCNQFLSQNNSKHIQCDTNKNKNSRQQIVQKPAINDVELTDSYFLKVNENVSAIKGVIPLDTAEWILRQTVKFLRTCSEKKCSIKLLSVYLQKCKCNDTGLIAFEELKKYYHKLSDFYRENPMHFEIRGEPSSHGVGGGREIVLLESCDLEVNTVNDTAEYIVGDAITTNSKEVQPIARRSLNKYSQLDGGNYHIFRDSMAENGNTVSTENNSMTLEKSINDEATISTTSSSSLMTSLSTANLASEAIISKAISIRQLIKNQQEEFKVLIRTSFLAEVLLNVCRGYLGSSGSEERSSTLSELVGFLRDCRINKNSTALDLIHVYYKNITCFIEETSCMELVQVLNKNKDDWEVKLRNNNSESVINSKSVISMIGNALPKVHKHPIDPLKNQLIIDSFPIVTQTDLDLVPDPSLIITSTSNLAPVPAAHTSTESTVLSALTTTTVISNRPAKSTLNKDPVTTIAATSTSSSLRTTGIVPLVFQIGALVPAQLTISSYNTSGVRGSMINEVCRDSSIVPNHHCHQDVVSSMVGQMITETNVAKSSLAVANPKNDNCANMALVNMVIKLLSWEQDDSPTSLYEIYECIKTKINKDTIKKFHGRPAPPDLMEKYSIVKDFLRSNSGHFTMSNISTHQATIGVVNMFQIYSQRDQEIMEVINEYIRIQESLSASSDDILKRLQQHFLDDTHSATEALYMNHFSLFEYIQNQPHTAELRIIQPRRFSPVKITMLPNIEGSIPTFKNDDEMVYKAISQYLLSCPDKSSDAKSIQSYLENYLVQDDTTAHMIMLKSHYNLYRFITSFDMRRYFTVLPNPHSNIFYLKIYNANSTSSSTSISHMMNIPIIKQTIKSQSLPSSPNKIKDQEAGSSEIEVGTKSFEIVKEKVDLKKVQSTSVTTTTTTTKIFEPSQNLFSGIQAIDPDSQKFPLLIDVIIKYLKACPRQSDSLSKLKCYLVKLDINDGTNILDCLQKEGTSLVDYMLKFPSQLGVRQLCTVDKSVIVFAIDNYVDDVKNNVANIKIPAKDSMKCQSSLEVNVDHKNDSCQSNQDVATNICETIDGNQGMDSSRLLLHPCAPIPKVADTRLTNISPVRTRSKRSRSRSDSRDRDQRRRTCESPNKSHLSKSYLRERRETERKHENSYSRSRSKEKQDSPRWERRFGYRTRRSRSYSIDRNYNDSDNYNSTSASVSTSKSSFPPFSNSVDRKWQMDEKNENKSKSNIAVQKMKSTEASINDNDDVHLLLNIIIQYLKNQPGRSVTVTKLLSYLKRNIVDNNAMLVLARNENELADFVVRFQNVLGITTEHKSNCNGDNTDESDQIFLRNNIKDNSEYLSTYLEENGKSCGIPTAKQILANQLVAKDSEDYHILNIIVEYLLRNPEFADFLRPLGIYLNGIDMMSGGSVLSKLKQDGKRTLYGFVKYYDGIFGSHRIGTTKDIRVYLKNVNVDKKSMSTSLEGRKYTIETSIKANADKVSLRFDRGKNYGDSPRSRDGLKVTDIGRSDRRILDDVDPTRKRRRSFNSDRGSNSGKHATYSDFSQKPSKCQESFVDNREVGETTQHSNAGKNESCDRNKNNISNESKDIAKVECSYTGNNIKIDNKSNGRLGARSTYRNIKEGQKVKDCCEELPFDDEYKQNNSSLIINTAVGSEIFNNTIIDADKISTSECEIVINEEQIQKQFDDWMNS